jgi:hypothetical protein
MKQRFLVLCAALVGISSAAALDDDPLFHSRDPLSQRDSWGSLHQSPTLNATDFAPRESWRLFYYSKSRQVLAGDVAYVGALQRALQRTGYYCGPINGYFSPEVSDAIARLQKNHSMRVTGHLTVPVRRALYLP